MPEIDRRTGGERRNATRYRVNIDVEWEGPRGRRQGTLGDISELGCFILCSADIEDGTPVGLFFPIPDGRKVRLAGEVMNHLIEIGFAARFTELTPAHRDLLQKLVDSYNQNN